MLFMTAHTATLGDRLTTLPSAKYVFFVLIILLFGIAVGHLYLFHGLTAIYLGLPLWLWLEVVAIGVMLMVAWTAVRLVAVVSGESS